MLLRSLKPGSFMAWPKVVWLLAYSQSFVFEALFSLDKQTLKGHEQAGDGVSSICIRWSDPATKELHHVPK